MRLARNARFCAVHLGVVAFMVTLGESMAPAGEQAQELQVLVNQLGYLPNSVKRIVVEAAADCEKKDGRFDLVKASEVVHSGRLEYAGALWGRHCWVGEFTPFSTAGEFKVRARLGAQSGESFPFRISRDVYDKALHLACRFFYYQRCGCKVEGWHEACHLDDGFLAGENRHVDATGGWHDAGDYNKWGADAFTTYALLTAYDNGEALGSRERAEILAEALWGTRYLMKMITPAGGLYTGVREVETHGPKHCIDPAKDTDNVIGNADDRIIGGVSKGEATSQFAAAALAKVARLVAKSDPSLSRKARECAERLWASGPGKTVYGLAARLLADVELQRLSPDARYFADTSRTAAALLEALPQARSIAWNEITWAGVPNAALTLWLKTFPDATKAPLASAIRAALDQQHARLRGLSANPFGILQFYADADGKTEYSWFMPRKLERYGKWPGNPPGYTGPAFYQRVGLNSYYASFAWSLLLHASLTSDPSSAQVAQRQLDWILGANPLNLCMMQAAGSKHPARLFTNMMFIRGHEDPFIPGAIPNGIDRRGEDDVPYFDLRTREELKAQRADIRGSYCSAEVWLPNNANFILALSELLSQMRK